MAKHVADAAPAPHVARSSAPRTVRRRDLDAARGAGARSCSRSMQPQRRTRTTAASTASTRSARSRTTRAAVPPNTYETLSPYIERTLARREERAHRRRPADVRDHERHDRQGEVHPGDAELHARVQPRRPRPHCTGCSRTTATCWTGKILVRRSNDVEGHTEGGLPYGAISGYLTRTQPGAIKRFYALPYELCKVKDVEAKYYLTLRHALPADVRLIVMPNPSSMVLLADKMAALRRGADRRHPARARSTRPTCRRARRPRSAPACEPIPRRADELAAILRATGRLLPIEVWPNLRLL